MALSASVVAVAFFLTACVASLWVPLPDELEPAPDNVRAKVFASIWSAAAIVVAVAVIAVRQRSGDASSPARMLCLIGAAGVVTWFIWSL